MRLVREDFFVRLSAVKCGCLYMTRFFGVILDFSYVRSHVQYSGKLHALSLFQEVRSYTVERSL